MKSLKAKFKKADVSAIPGDMGTRGPALGCSLGHEDLGVSLRMSPLSQGHGVVTHSRDSSPTEVGTVTLAGAIESPVHPQCSQSHRWERGRAKHREADPRSPPCPLPGDKCRFASCHSPWNQPVDAPQLFSSSLARGRRGHRGTELSPVHWQGTAGDMGTHRLKPLTRNLGDHPAPCLSFPTRP